MKGTAGSSDCYAGGLTDDEMPEWLAQSRQFSNGGRPRSRPPPSIRLLLCERIGWQPLGFAMSRSSFLAMEKAFGLPEEMLPLIAGNSGTHYWSFQHDDERDKSPTSIGKKSMFRMGSMS